MYTPLFYGVETPSSFFAPVLEPLQVARLVVKNIEERRGGEIYAPWYVGYMYVPLFLIPSLLFPGTHSSIVLDALADIFGSFHLFFDLTKLSDAVA
jgi:hypothetical protein